VPTSTIVSTAFHRHGRLAAKNLHIDDLPLIVTPHPLNDLTPEQVKDLARACYPAIVRQLTGAVAQQKDDIIAFVHPNARSRQTRSDLTDAKS
jgi:hypothetical protein